MSAPSPLNQVKGKDFPMWDRKAANVTFTVLVVIGIFAFIYLVRRTIFIFVLAAFFAYMIYPLVRFLGRNRPAGASPVAATAAAFVLVFMVILLAATLVGPSLAEQAARFSDQLPTLFQQSRDIASWPWPAFLRPYGEQIAGFIRGQLQTGAAEALPVAQRIGTELLRAAGNAVFVVLIPVLAFLLIVNARRMRDGLGTLLGESWTVWQGVLDDLHRLLGGYIRALLLLSLASFVAYGAFLSISGVPYGALLAALAASLEFIPVFGPLFAAVVILLVAGISGYEHLVWIVFFIAVYRVFQDYVLAPKLMGEGVGVHPILVLLGLLAGEELAGVPGMFLSVPVVAAAIVVARHLGTRPSDARSAHRK